MKNNLFYIFSPCVIVLIILAVGLLKDTVQGGWHLLGVVVGLPMMVVIAVIGIITKLAIRKSNGLLWMIEILLIVACFVVLPRLYK